MTYEEVHCVATSKNNSTCQMVDAGRAKLFVRNFSRLLVCLSTNVIRRRASGYTLADSKDVESPCDQIATQWSCRQDASTAAAAGRSLWCVRRRTPKTSRR